MDRDLSMEFVRVTEAAAVACGRLIGKGDKNGADGLAVDAMRQMFDTVHISGTVVIGEGEMDEAPMLYIGEKVGAGGPEVDIAVDPVEGTNLTAKGQNGAIAVMAIAPRGCLLHAPDMYMDKIVVGPKAIMHINSRTNKPEKIIFTGRSKITEKEVNSVEADKITITTQPRTFEAIGKVKTIIEQGSKNNNRNDMEFSL